MKDRAPKKERYGDDPYVWYYFELIGVAYGQFSEEDFCFYGAKGYTSAKDVTDWMPAPPPPHKLRSKVD